MELEDFPEGFGGLTSWYAVERALELFGERNWRGGTKGNKPGSPKGTPRTIFTAADREAKKQRHREAALRSYHRRKALKSQARAAS